MQRGSAVLGRQRGLGGFPHERLPFPQRLPVRSWGGSAVLGRQRGLGGNPHSRFAVVSPTRAWDQEVRFIFVQVLIIIS
ncbi:MAG: hypothetical protein F6K55_08045 [Moorea sp. SIO4A3]|nr:hypothetical protein [Moorena sp. SIO4A3]